MVYRPPKHKPGALGFGSSRPAPNRPDSDSFGASADSANDPKGPLAGDDRNLVAVDESYTGGDLEDRLWILWQRQGKNILRAVIVLALGVAAWEGWQLYQKHVTTVLQAEYQVQSDKGPSGLLDFAQAHPDNILGKLAVLEAADSFYKDNKFKDAADAYTKAAGIWASDEKGQRARLGLALSLLQSGDITGAEQKLTDLAEDSSAVQNYRAEAAFYAAVVYAQNGDDTNAAKWLGEVTQFKNQPLWTSQATTLQEIIPTLASLKIVPGSGKISSEETPATVTPAPVTIPGMPTLTPAAPPAPVTSAPVPTASTAKPAATSASPASTGASQLAPLSLPKLN